ncbi:MAG: radical SAM protein [Nanobdellota archaeon]
MIRTRPFGNRILATSENGRWLLLTREEFRQLENPDPILYKKLETNKLIMTHNNQHAIEQDMRQKMGMLYQSPTLHIIVPTTRCNQNCIYCHSMPCDQQDMSKETAKQTLDFILKSPARSLTIEFQGGEPLLNFEVVRYIIEQARKSPKKISFDLVTNLTLMDESKASYLMDNNVSICTSLDGPESIHNTNRPPDSHKETVKWIRYFQEKRYPINAGLVITRNSIGKGKEIVNEYLELGLRWIKLRPADPTGKALQNPIVPTAEEYIGFWTETIEYLLEMNKRTFLPDRHTYYILTKLYNRPAYYSELASPCGAILGQLAYNPDGSISCCDEARIHDLFTIGTTDQPFRDVITSEQACSIMAASMNDTLLCDACVFKPFCGVCPVCTYAQSGSLVPINSQDDRCKILQAQFTHIIHMLQNQEKREILETWLERTKR